MFIETKVLKIEQKNNWMDLDFFIVTNIWWIGLAFKNVTMWQTKILKSKAVLKKSKDKFITPKKA